MRSWSDRTLNRTNLHTDYPASRQIVKVLSRRSRVEGPKILLSVQAVVTANPKLQPGRIANVRDPESTYCFCGTSSRRNTGGANSVVNMLISNTTP